MKKVLFVVALLFTGATVSFAQNAPAAKTESKAKTTQPGKGKGHAHSKGQAKKVADKWECPMKCEAAASKPGKCGKCGMDLKKVKTK